MRQIPFLKVAGCGNDFVLLDGRRRSLPRDPGRWAQVLCDRRRGVGADGLLLVLPSRRAKARMRIFNPDGSEAQMCGNGLRCVAWYLHRTNGARRSFHVETGAGLMKAQITGHERVRFYPPPPRQLRLGLRLTHRGRVYHLHAVNTGVPHAVLFFSHPEKVDLVSLGPWIRSHRLFRPAGANVDLVRVDSPHRITLRTYERGVEAETLACGTGAVASAVIGAALGKLKPPVQVSTRGGEKLTVSFRPDRHPWDGLYLEGPARILFEGGIPR